MVTFFLDYYSLLLVILIFQDHSWYNRIWLEYFTKKYNKWENRICLLFFLFSVYLMYSKFHCLPTHNKIHNKGIKVSLSNRLINYQYQTKYRLELWATCILNLDKRKMFMYFNQNSAIFSLNGKPLKLVNQFKYLGSNISLTENNVNIHFSKGWTNIDMIWTTWKSEFSHEIKRQLF